MSASAKQAPPATPPDEDDGRSELRSYLIGYAAAVVLTAAAFAAVHFDWVEGASAGWTIGLLALAQVVVHFYYFLHIDLTRQKREDLQLILFTTLILILMIGGTVWIMLNLYGRMMPSMLPG